MILRSEIIDSETRSMKPVEAFPSECSTVRMRKSENLLQLRTHGVKILCLRPLQEQGQPI